MNDLDGKVAFITGGSSGIGLGMARAFAEAGLRVAITYRTRRNLDQAMTHLRPHGDRVHAISLDVTDRTAMEQAAQEVVKLFGKVHVAVANAGVGLHSGVSAASYEDFDWVMGINLTGVFNTIRCFLPRIRSHGEGGHIVATSSLAGLIAQGPAGVYTASKFAVVGLMEALRHELAGSHIGVTVFCPGVVNTNIPDCARNRPGARQPGAGPVRLPPDLAAAAMDPFEAGRRVLRGMRDDDMYVLTTPEFEAELGARGEAIVASLPADVDPSPARVAFGRELVGETDYIRERDRKLREAARSARRGSGLNC
jgi:NAD(P)-dependent dehydrogenase (short-subunit alcohol dehydrogenase family)